MPPRLLLPLLLVLPLTAAENRYPGGDFDPGATAPSGQGVTLVADGDDNHVLRLDRQYAHAQHELALDPDWRLVAIAGRLRTREVQRGEQDWQVARMAMEWLDAAGEHVDPWPAMVSAEGTTPWQRFERWYEIPAGAARLRVGPALFAPSGVAEFDDIRVTGWSERPPTTPATPIALGTIANRALADETADDGRGGWSDQGPANDLSALPDGELQIGDVTFAIGTGDAAMLVLARDGRRGAPETSAELTLDGRRCRSLFLLNALAWAPKDRAVVGRVEVRYADGREETLELRNREEVGDWWGPRRLPNAAVAWGTQNGSSGVGLFCTQLLLRDAPVASLRFAAAGSAVWGIAGLAASPDVVALPAHSPFTLDLADDPDWAPIGVMRDVVPGSILDLSGGLDAPAGKHGFLIARDDGRFVFEQRPDRPVRLLGTNTGYANNFLDPGQQDQLVDRLAALGYNSLRLHHFDHIWDIGGGGLPATGGPTHVLDPERLDRLDRLIHRCKQRGIYVTIDLFTDRRFRPGQIAGFDYLVGHEYKALIPIYESAMQEWQTFARNLLAHRNPYTGLTWAEDPAICTISVVNEDYPLTKWDELPEIARERYRELFVEWLAAGDHGAPEGAARERLWQRFITQTQLAAYERMKGFLREELGCRQLLTDCNWHTWNALAPIRSELDFVDNHGYWNHPHLINGWNLPMGFHHHSALTKRAELPRRLMPSRILGKPFTVSEFQYCYPNRHRAEGGLVMGALAAFQDWDGLYRFALGDHLFAADGDAIAPFDSIDPMTGLGDLVIACAFGRGDVAPGQRLLVQALSPASAYADQPLGWGSGHAQDAIADAGLTARVASAYADGPLALDADVVVATDPGQALTGAGEVVTAGEGLDQRLRALGYGADEDGVWRSDTGELALDPQAARMTVDSPRLAGAVGDRPASLAAIDLAPADWCTLVAISRDGEPLARSRRILVLHLTDAKNDGLRYGDPARSVVEAWGEGAIHARDGAATLRLRSAHADLAVHAVDLTGTRRERLSVRRVDGALEIDLRVVRDWGGCFVYEIVGE